jgi:hypothetical protein
MANDRPIRSTTTTARPPVLGKARFTCHDEGAIAVAKLRNLNKTTMDFMVLISGEDFDQEVLNDVGTSSPIPWCG